MGGIPLDEAVLVALLEPPWTTAKPELATEVMRGMNLPAGVGGVVFGKPVV